MDFSLRGYSFEYIAKILIRRNNNNNFIFQTCQFDSIREILTKYKLKPSEKTKSIVEYLEIEWNRCDLLEFILDDARNIENIIFYEVKTKINTAKRKYFELCQSNKSFLDFIATKGYTAYLVSIILYERWRFSLNCIPYEKAEIVSYTNYKKSPQHL